MRKNIKKRIALIAAIVMSMSVFSGCSLFSGTKPDDYIEAVMNATLKGDTKRYKELYKLNDSEVKKNMEQTTQPLLTSISKSLELTGADISSDQEKKVKSFTEDYLKNAKFSVKSAKENRDKSYTVEVEVEPLKAFEAEGGKLRTYTGKLERRADEGEFKDMEQEEIAKEVAEEIIEEYKVFTEKPEYEKKTTVKVKVESKGEKKGYRIAQSDINKLIWAAAKGGVKQSYDVTTDIEVGIASALQGNLDIAGYTIASLDALFKGDLESYKIYSDTISIFEEKGNTYAVDALTSSMVDAIRKAGFTVTAEMEMQIKDLSSKYLQNAKYEVTSVERVNAQKYDVAVSVEPFIALDADESEMTKYLDNLMKRVEAGEFSSGSYEQAKAALAPEFVNAFQAYVDTPTYEAAQTVTLSVTITESGEYQINYLDLTEIVRVILG